MRPENFSAFAQVSLPSSSPTMPGLAEANEATFISSHSADVILSDIRPFKLQAEALRSINVFLDELLYTILGSSKSLVTDRLRASLLGLLPTSIGKEALLEAEVELRAYWERTAHSGRRRRWRTTQGPSTSNGLLSPLQLLRNKCEAYSTLNEADEDPSIEGLINERFGRSGASPPKAALVSPAALYLTAILEAICEHILSNVGRVAARDSSRTTATVNDLFTALCEDAAIYGYFRTMRVYDQIEQLSKSSKPTRRSKSFTRNGSISRTSTPQQEPLSHTPTMSASLSRQSSASSAAPNGHVQSASRTSFEKSRALRMFTGKSSHEREDSHHSGHKKSASFSEQGRQPSFERQAEETVEDAAMLQEFDDLMRSASTMKMSLTPDRLKTMEVYKQEKDQRQNRRPQPLATKQSSELLSPPPLPPALSPARQVDSILEDEEEGSPRQMNNMRPRQGSVHSPPPPPLAQSSSMPPGRARSVSHSVSRKPVRPPKAPSAFPPSLHTSTSIPNLSQGRSLHGNPHGSDSGGGPVRKRTRQRARESMDLDDIMNGSDDENAEPPVPQLPPTQRRTPKVSSTTRDLMDFLASGPPEDFAPPSAEPGASTASLDKPKTNRLQRMISKLNIGATDKPKQSIDSPIKSAPGHYRTATGGQAPTHPGAFSPLANRPIPPRPPKPPQPIEPISPPSSPSQHSLAEGQNGKASPTVTSPPGPSRFIPLAHHPSSRAFAIAVAKVTLSDAEIHHERDTLWQTYTPRQWKWHSQSYRPLRSNPSLRKPVPKEDTDLPYGTGSAPSPRPIEHAAPVHSTPPPTSASGGLTGTDLLDMQRLLASATTADECRLIFDMFMAGTKAGLAAAQRQPRAVEPKSPYPSPSPSLIKTQQLSQGRSAAPSPDATLEDALVDFLLGGSESSPVPDLSVSHQAQEQPSSPPSPPKRRLPRPPKGDAVPGPSFTPSAQQHTPREREQDNPVASTWRNPSDFQPHATSIPA
ncbi:hypothetical protein NMY22_g2151 [Coprinellus aureogranulatus]|nr:hypothetical protein NMY22_g2151 [Coprinellus aureogranulatus]